MNRIADLRQGEFLTADLVAASGVTKNVIFDWIRRDIFSNTQAPGRGRDRIFSFQNVVEAVVAARLMRLGMNSETYKTVLRILDFEANVLNTYLQRKELSDDFVIVLLIDEIDKPVSNGIPHTIYREGPSHRQPDYRHPEANVVSIRVDVGQAIAHARRSLKV